MSQGDGIGLTPSPNGDRIRGNADELVPPPNGGRLGGGRSESSEASTPVTTLHLFEPDSFRPLARIDRNAQGQAAVYHYHLDHLGTPREMTDAQGRIVWSAIHRAHGSLALADIELIDNNLRFQGQYFDRETGLHYNLNRYYEPSSGRFIHQDPIGLEGGENLYEYAPNPVNWVDPWGLKNKKVPGVVKEFDIVPYRPGNSPLENHHGVLDVWASNNVPGYTSRAAGSPTMALSKEAHAATKQVYRDWLTENFGKPVGVKVDWSNISAPEMQGLSERMFDAAKVPQAARANYYREFNQYIYGFQ